MLSQARSLWRVLRDRAQFERELDDELRFHLQCRAADLVAGGLSPAAALRQARVELGSAGAHKDAVRESRGLRLLDELAADVGFAWRSWRRHRGLALAVIATLTIGIGASTSVFTLVNAFIFRVWGVNDPATFARVMIARAQAPRLPDDFEAADREDLEALLRGTGALAVVAGTRAVEAPLGDDPAGVTGRLTTCNVFSMFGPVGPRLGRLLDPGDCVAGSRVLVLSEGFWRHRFGADPHIVGRVLRYGTQPYTIVGVVEAAFSGRMTQARVWLPYTLSGDWPAARDWQARFEVAARLRPGASRTQAAAELQVLMADADRLHPGRQSRVRVTDGSMWQQDTRHRAALVTVLALLMGALAMIVLLAAANVVTLLLSRAHARRQEIAVRLALGAGSRRLIKMLITETLLLAGAAAGLSLLVARELPPLLLRWLAPEPTDLALPLDWRVWAFLVGVTVGAGLISGLTPALEALNVDLVASLKGQLKGGAGRPRKLPVRGLLIAVQIALSLALLVGAGLFARSYGRMPLDGTSFETRQALWAALDTTGTAEPSWPTVHAALRTALRAIPSVQSVAFSDNRPPTGRPLEVRTTDGRAQRVRSNRVSGGFFATISLRVQRGRPLDDRDLASGGLIPVVVSQRLAGQLWPGRDPLGQELLAPDGTRFSVVGVAEDVIVPGESDGYSLYRPLAPGRNAVLVRFAGPPGPTIVQVRAAIARAAPGVDGRPRTFQDRFEHQAAELKPAVGITLGLGLAALLLALAGVHGVVAFAARRQLREIGVRLALGASRGDVLRALMLPVGRAVGLGIGGGLLLTFLAAPALAASVQEMDVLDPLPYLGAALLLAATAAVATIRPARWALRVDPARVLRE
jgi:predicted permease